MIEQMVKIVAKNPASILIVGGLIFLLTNNSIGWLLIIAGIGLNLAWLR